MHSTPFNISDDAISVRYLLEPVCPYLADPDVTEICVNKPGQVYIEKNGSWEMHEVESLTYDKLNGLGVAVARYSSNDFGETVPVLSAVLPGGERVQFVRPPACTAGTISVTIRKPSHQVRSLDDYIESGFFDHVTRRDTLNDDDLELLKIYNRLNDPNIDQKDAVIARAAFLEQAVRRNKNIVIAGETGSGKTTFMKALMQSIPNDQRILTIEDVPELFLPNHDNHVHLFYPSEAKEDSIVTASSLLRSCLRMKPDRILLAELRGGETFDFLNVCLSGHGGSITSCHSGSCRGVFEYLTLKTLQSPAGKTLPYNVIQKLLYLTIDVVVHVHNDRAFGRHITEIWFDPAVKYGAQNGQQQAA